MTDKLRNIILLFLCLLSIQIAFAQKERAANWYFGFNAGLKFLPIVTSDTLGQVATLEGCATISDSCGNLLFYTDGSTVYNKNHSIMTNGTGLGGNYSSTQSALIVPKPLNDSIYYLFTTGGLNGNYCYSEININSSGGLGSVITKNNFLCFNYFNEKQAAIVHCNNQDVWVICVDSAGYNYYSFLVNGSGISLTPFVSSIGVNIGGAGYLKFSPDGNYLANANSLADSISISIFNNCTGQITPFVSSPADTGVYGVSFSSNSSKLYIANTLIQDNKCYLWQYDLSSGNSNSIITSKTLIKQLPDNIYYGSLQLGGDDRIYVVKYDDLTGGLNYLATINNPNAIGISCNYSDSTLSILPRTNLFGLPSFIESYFKTNYTCSNLTSIENNATQNIVKIYPNPFASTTNISLTSNLFRKIEFRLYDNIGLLKKSIILNKSLTELNRKNLTSGIYIYQIISDNKLLETGRLIIE